MHKLKLEMADVVRAHMEIHGCPVLTSNQCHALAMKLNEKIDFDAIVARVDDALRSDVDLQKELERCASMAEMVREREWAEHVGEGHVSTCVELAFTQLHNELHVLQERLAETEKDAARYRWLRDRPLDGSEPFWIAVRSDDVYQTRCWALGGSSPDTCDQAIDKAMSSAGPADQEQQS